MATIVYKYVTADRIDVLRNGRIRFTQPLALNDPFESLPCLTKFRAQLIESRRNQADKGSAFAIPDQFRQLLADRLLTDLPDMFGNLFAFLSVSAVPDNLLMWSHYAGAHTGFVVGFDADHAFFAPGNFAVEGLKAVEYSRERFVMPPLGLSEMTRDELDKVNRQFFFTKSVDWAYERELRILASPRDANTSIPDKPPILLYDFPSEIVQEVIFGFRMQPEQKQELAQLISDKYCDAALMQARPHSEQYALDIVPYSSVAAEEQRMALAKELTYQFRFTDSA